MGNHLGEFMSSINKSSKVKIGFFVSTAIVVSSAFLIAACETGKKVEAGKESLSWPAKMQAMATDLERLMPFVFSRQEFSDAKNKRQIQRLIASYSGHAHVIPEHVGEALMGEDPLVGYSIDRLREKTDRAVSAFNEGHIEFSRGLLKESMGMCFSCHTTTQLGPQENFGMGRLEGQFRIFPSERAEYYVATRQYDLALETLESVLQRPGSFYENAHEQLSAMRKYLSIVTRVKGDPARAARTVRGFLDRDKVPHFLATDGQAWLRSLDLWAREGEITRNHIARATTIIEQGRRAQSAGGFQAGYVDFLRASHILHEALRATDSPAQLARIYKMLGESYDILVDLGVWDLPEVYFEACIRKQPRTNIARDCYRNFERVIVVGFSGSAGIFIPADERRRLTELKELAGL